MPLKSVNSFIFVRFSQVQKLLSSVSTGLKKHLKPLHLSCERHTAAALSTRCHSLRVAFGSVVSALRVHFLTLVSNYPKVKEQIQHAFTFPSFRCARIQFAAVVPVVSGRSLYLGAKL